MYSKEIGHIISNKKCVCHAATPIVLEENSETQQSPKGSSLNQRWCKFELVGLNSRRVGNVYVLQSEKCLRGGRSEEENGDVEREDDTLRGCTSTHTHTSSRTVTHGGLYSDSQHHGYSLKLKGLYQTQSSAVSHTRKQQVLTQFSVFLNCVSQQITENLSVNRLIKQCWLCIITVREQCS